MKVTKHGREFDEIVKHFFEPDTEFLIWGAANIGMRFVSLYQNKLNIAHVYDGDEKKAGELLWNYTIESIENIVYSSKRIMVVTCSYYEEIRPKMEKLGFIHNQTLFNYEEFEKLFWVYRHNYLRSTRIDISLTERCNLNCEKCNMFMPYFKEPKDNAVEKVKEDLDAYFDVVDWVKYLNLLGGEPFLYKDLAEIIRYIGEAYGNRIERTVLFTNGMIVPNKEILDLLKQYNVYVQLSDYTNAVNYRVKFDKLLKLLNSYQISHYVLPQDVWGDFGFPTDPNTIRKEEDAIRMFDKCNPPFRGLWEKKVYFCHLETSAVRAGLFSDVKSDYFLLDKQVPEMKKRFLEFDFGHTETGYLQFCKVCRGCGCVNSLTVPAAAQMKR